MTVNAVVGSDADLPINTLVQLDNVNIGGELTYTWAILDQPPGSADALSSVSAQNPFFTPKKEGTYLIRLLVNQGQITEQEDRVICGVVQLKTLERIPAAGETTEGDSAEGWQTPLGSMLRRMDALLSDPGIFVGVNASGGALTRGDVLRATASSIIKTGLPGQETVPGFSKALATVVGNIDEPLVVCEGTVAGGGSVANGGLMKIRFLGRYASNTGGVAVVGDPVYVSDTGTMSLTPGTVKRKVGVAMTAGATYDVWFAGMGGEDITPIDRAYLVYGPAGTLTNAHRVDGAAATPGATGGTSYLFKAGDAATVPLVAKGFAAGLDVFQAHSAGGTVLLSVDILGKFKVNSPTGTVVTGTFYGDQTTLGAHLLTVTNHPLYLGANNTDFWEILAAGTLQAVGADRLVSLLAKPAEYRDAARRNYVDVHHPNLIINGTFDFWQRGTTINLAAAIPDGKYGPDRWYTAETGAGANWTGVVTAAGVTIGPNTAGFAARVQRDAGQTGTNFRHLVQEIDRKLLTGFRRSAGGTSSRLLTVQFWGQAGANYSAAAGALLVLLKYSTGAGALPEENAINGYTGGTASQSTTVTLTTTPTQYRFTFPTGAALDSALDAALQFTVTPVGTAGANDWFQIWGVELVQAENKDDIIDRPYQYAGGSYAGELALCQSYYEKSYDLFTALGTNTIVGTEMHTPASINVVNNNSFNGVCPKFKVQKRKIPTVTVWDQGGTINSWDFDTGAGTAGPYAVTVINPSERGFRLQNTSGGTVTWVQGFSTGHWAADAEIPATV